MLSLLLASAAAHDFKTCGVDHLRISKVDLSPDPVVAGKSLSVQLTGIPDQDITGGTATVTIKALGVVIDTLRLDLCKDLNTTCPRRKDTPLTVSVVYDVPKAAPGGVTAEVTVNVKSTAGADISCVTLQVKLVKGVFGHKFLFGQFMRQYGKKYETSELIYRMHVFGENFRKVLNHTLHPSTYTMALNEFADLTWEEFKSSRLGYKASSAPRKEVSLPKIDVDDEVDWRTKGVVTPVKDQGQCGSCWAFSATGSAESAYAIAKGDLLSFSEQQLVDCAGSFGNQGCNGGWMDYAFDYIKTRGLCLESDYAYMARDRTCQASGCKPVNAVKEYVDVRAGDENALLQAVAQQPVSVAIEADQGVFQFYRSGILEAGCGTQLDHGVLAVGYGTDNQKPYWLVKNSWGPSWGDKGYIRIIRGKNMCGIALAASYPLA